MIEEKTLGNIIDILDTYLHCNKCDNQVEVWIAEFNLVKLNLLNVNIALYAIAKTEQEAKKLLAERMSGKFLIRTRRFENDICPIYPMPEKVVA